MRYRWMVILCVAALCPSCGPVAPAFDPSPHALWTDPETGMGFAVVPINEHPFLVDHDRQLVIVPPRRKPIRVELYGEMGFIKTSHSANLYKDDQGRFIVIDVNGIWLTINPATGQVVSCQWRWEEPTPRRYLGTFETGNPVVYRFIPADQGVEPPIYGFKDPSHPLLKEKS